MGQLPARARHFRRRALADRLLAAAADAPTAVPSQVLSGMAGIGKTQLAADYAHHVLHEGAVDAAVWVDAGSRAQTVATYAQAARAVGAVAPGASAEPEEQAQAFLSWLRTTPRRWLVVLDGVAPPSGDAGAPLGLEYLDGLWPPETTAGRGVSAPQGADPGWSGRTLITTRRKDAALASGNRSVLGVGVFTADEAAEFLNRALAEHGISSPAEDGADALARDLGYLPLALAQAAAYIADENSDCSAYRRMLADPKHRLDQLAPGAGSLPTGHTRTAAATLALSFDHADRFHPAGWARPLMQVLGLLAADAVPVSVLTAPSLAGHLAAGADARGGAPAEGDEAAAPAMVLRALGVLRRISLITTTGPLTADRTIVQVHTLIQRAARETLTPEQLAGAAPAAAAALLHAWPQVEGSTALGRSLRACTAALDSQAPDVLWDPDRRPLLFRAGISLHESGQVQASADYWRRMHGEAERRLGPDHRDVLSVRNNLASATGSSGDPAEAARLFAELVAAEERILGPDHPKTLGTRNNHACWTYDSGWPGEAARLFAELLPAQERVLGADHPETLTIRNNIASCTGRGGNPSEAARLFTELLLDLQRVQGPDHPHTLATRDNHALYTAEAGNPAEALRLFATLLDDEQRVLGADHPDTLATRNNLAHWTGHAGDPGEALRLLRELDADQERLLGPDHLQTLTTRGNIEYWQSGDGAGGSTG